MKISVLVASYKRPDYLTKCLNSLARQTRLPDEVIVIVRKDDLETWSMFDTFENPFSSIENRSTEGGEPLHSPQGILKIVSVEQPGIVKAENCGLNAARGEIIAMIDDDAIALVDWLQRIEQYYLDPRIGAVGGPTIPYINGTPKLEKTKATCLKKTWYGGHYGNSEKVPNKTREVHVLRGCNMSFRKSLVGKFDTRLKPYWRRFEDDMILGIYRQNFKVIYDPQIQVYHHTAPVIDTQTRDSDPDTIFGSHHNNTYVMLKHSSSLKRLIFLGFTFFIGDRVNPGLIGYLIKGLLKNNISQSLEEWSWAARGKVEGIRTYRDWAYDNKRA